jgi:uncharacterized protein YjbI with pentapeptide repeats
MPTSRRISLACVLLGVMGSSAPVAAANISRTYGSCTLVSGRATNVCENADLRGANLSWMDLRGAKFRGSNMAGANLQGSLLTDADLSSVVLNHANLFATMLSGANLHGSQLEFVNATFAHFVKSNLRVANFAGANLGLAVLHEANAEGANFYGASLVQALFTSANLRGTNFAHATFLLTHMGGSDATNANFFPSNLAADFIARHGLFVRIDDRIHAYGDYGSCRVVRPTSGYDTVDWNDYEVSCGGEGHSHNQEAFKPRVWFSWFRRIHPADERYFEVGVPTGILRLDGVVVGNGAYQVTKVHGMAGFPSGITQAVGAPGGPIALNLQWEGDGYYLHMTGWLPRHTGMVTSRAHVNH